MVVVAVTRGGFGDVWLFGSRTEAFLHPLVQYGDSIIHSPECVRAQYNQLEWAAIRRVAGLQPTAVVGGSPRHFRGQSEAEAPAIYQALVAMALPAPTDPAEICRVVTADRRVYTVARKKADAPAEAAPAASAGASTKTSNLPTPVKGPKGAPQDAVIAFGMDKENKPYSAVENNPKKEGSKTRTRFAMYVEGMTIKQALDAGITTADLVYDREHGFVSWSGGSEAAALVSEPTTEPTESEYTKPPEDVVEDEDEGIVHAHDHHHGHHASAD